MCPERALSSLFFLGTKRFLLIKSRSNSVAGFLEVVGITVGCAFEERSEKKRPREKGSEREKEREEIKENQEKMGYEERERTRP